MRAEPFLGQIELFAFASPPKGWTICAGHLLPIAQNSALFSLLGTSFGGDGRTNFALPDLRGAAAIGQGQGPGLTPRPVGAVAGTETATLTVDQIPSHHHEVAVARQPVEANNVFTPDGTTILALTTGSDKEGTTIPFDIYAVDSAPTVPMAADMVGTAGGQPHANMMPYLAGNFCIALQGIFPSRA